MWFNYTTCELICYEVLLVCLPVVKSLFLDVVVLIYFNPLCNLIKMYKNIKIISILSLSTLVIFAGYFRIKSNARKNRIIKLKKQLEIEIMNKDESRTQHNEQLIREQLSRNYAFLGEIGQSKVRDAFIIVVGLGGVGSHAYYMTSFN